MGDPEVTHYFPPLFPVPVHALPSPSVPRALTGASLACPFPALTVWTDPLALMCGVQGHVFQPYDGGFMKSESSVQSVYSTPSSMSSSQGPFVRVSPTPSGKAEAQDVHHGVRVYLQTCQTPKTYVFPCA